jgi:hypothetical protein
LQPGGEVLPGASAQERDFAFGKELSQRLPLLFGGRIETVEQASAAQAQLLALDPVNLKVGIPFIRLAEDVVHGTEHSSIAQWLPEDAPTIPEAELAGWYQAEDAYLAKPGPATLHDLLTLHQRLVNTNRMLGLGALSASKFRALLVLQDRMRVGAEARPAMLTSDVAAFGHFNPIWEAGEVTRDFMSDSAPGIGMDATMQAQKLVGPSFSDQMHQMRASWFWAGWLSDQGMFRTSYGDKTRLGMWFSESLSKDGPYPFHDVYANARRQAVVSNNPASWGETPDRKRLIWDFAGLRSFAEYQTDMPTEPAARHLYIRFTTNCFRMSLFLYRAELQKTHVVWVRKSAEANVRQLISFIEAQDPEDRSNAERLRQELFSLADQATDRY